MEYYIEHCITIDIEIDKGRITDVDIKTNFNETYDKMKPVICQLLGTRFWYEDIQKKLTKMKVDLETFGEKELSSWVIYCISKTLFVN